MTRTLEHTLGEENLARRQAAPPEESAVLFVLLEADRPLQGSSRHSLEACGVVRVGRGSVRSAERLTAPENVLKLSLPDAHMSGVHATLKHDPAHDGWTVSDQGSKNGTWVNGASVEQHALRDGDLLELGRTLLLFRERMRSVRPLDFDVESPGMPWPLTLIPELERQLQRLKQLAPIPDIPLLIEGESGTGKEVLAQQIASWSGRQGRFVGVNCGALPESLLESELFGSVKGAFSGADRSRDGLVRASDGGCLFLDEIAELSGTSQAALLRVLQEREVLPVGSTQVISVDLRVVSATHQDLDALVEEDLFRQDLLARLGGYRITLPPLRERREDLGLLISMLLKQEGSAHKLRLSPEASRALFFYDWPLNIRELRLALKTAVALTERGYLELEHLPQALQRSGAPPSSLIQLNARLSREQTDQREQLVRLLTLHQGNVSAVARELGKARMQVQRWLKKYGLEAEAFRHA